MRTIHELYLSFDEYESFKLTPKGSGTSIITKSNNYKSQDSIIILLQSNGIRICVGHWVIMDVIDNTEIHKGLVREYCLLNLAWLDSCQLKWSDKFKEVIERMRYWGYEI